MIDNIIVPACVYIQQIKSRLQALPPWQTLTHTVGGSYNHIKNQRFNRIFPLAQVYLHLILYTSIYNYIVLCSLHILTYI